MLKWICLIALTTQPLCAAHGKGSGNADRRQEHYEDDKPTLYDINEGEMEDDVPNWNRSYREDDRQMEGGSCPNGACQQQRKLNIEDD